jgi:hypothetical protein
MQQNPALSDQQGAGRSTSRSPTEEIVRRCWRLGRLAFHPVCTRQVHADSGDGRAGPCRSRIWVLTLPRESCRAHQGSYGR